MGDRLRAPNNRTSHCRHVNAERASDGTTRVVRVMLNWVAVHQGGGGARDRNECADGRQCRERRRDDGN